MSQKRVFLIVLDSFGIGALPDAGKFGDEGSNTLASIAESERFSAPGMEAMGLFNIDGVRCGASVTRPAAAFARMAEKSMGKDTTIGHWEISGVISERPLPVFPNGFPDDVLREFSRRTGRGVLCNRPYSGTQVIRDFGAEHMKTGDLIVYTSADSVFQIAAHEDVVAVETLYAYCKAAREILTGENAVGRVIARPFVGTAPDFKRTANRHDFSLDPPRTTVLDLLKATGYTVISVGKINDIFNARGISESHPVKSNREGMQITDEIAGRDFSGLCFVNLVDFDMLYGHRNDVPGYAAAVTEFDRWLKLFLEKLREDDILMITGDHGCDPATPSTDHSREYTPLLIYGKKIRPVNLGTRETFADIGVSIGTLFGLDTASLDGHSFMEMIL